MMSRRILVRSCLPLARRRLAGCRGSSCNSLNDILRRVQDGKLDVQHAEKLILSQKQSPDEILKSFANLDHGRAMRTGFPEAVFAAGKTPEQVALILDDMAANVNQSVKDGQNNVASTAILATRYETNRGANEILFGLLHSVYCTSLIVFQSYT